MLLFVVLQEQDISDKFLGAVETKDSATVNPWIVPLINGTVTTFKIDTGANITGIPETVFKQLNNVTLPHSEGTMPELP